MNASMLPTLIASQLPAAPGESSAAAAPGQGGPASAGGSFAALLTAQLFAADGEGRAAAPGLALAAQARLREQEGEASQPVDVAFLATATEALVVVPLAVPVPQGAAAPVEPGTVAAAQPADAVRNAGTDKLPFAAMPEGDAAATGIADGRQALAASPAAIAARAAVMQDEPVAQAVQAVLSEADGPVPSPQAGAHAAGPVAAHGVPLPHAVPVAHGRGAAEAFVPAPVASPAWGEALGERVVLLLGQQHQSAALQLSPPALGPLEIKLSMQDGQASLVFSTQHAVVKDAIEAASLRLREMLGESGISLGSVSVNVGSFSQPQAEGQHLAQQSGRAWMGESAAADIPAAQSSGAMLLVRGLVDDFA